jgi:hypothetical protein
MGGIPADRKRSMRACLAVCRVGRLTADRECRVTQEWNHWREGREFG